MTLHARRRCARCGRWLERDARLKVAPRDDYVDLDCEPCGLATRTSYQLRPGPATDPAVDWLLGLPLWLRTRCTGHVLWAFNARHLAFVKAYLEADLREKGPSRHSAAAKLPGWLKLAKHRREALRAVARLERRLRGA